MKSALRLDWKGDARVAPDARLVETEVQWLRVAQTLRAPDAAGVWGARRAFVRMGRAMVAGRGRNLRKTCATLWMYCWRSCPIWSATKPESSPMS